ncbi:2967_t:CDS:2, partial [Racocetra fulgida]
NKNADQFTNLLAKRTIGQIRLLSLSLFLLVDLTIVLDDEVQQIHKIIPQIDSDLIPQIHKTLTNVVNHTKDEEIFQSIREITESQKTNTLKLFTSMRNPKGKHVNQVISPYLQKQALDFITDPQKGQVKKLKVKNAELESSNKKLLKNNQNLISKAQSLV